VQRPARRRELTPFNRLWGEAAVSIWTRSRPVGARRSTFSSKRSLGFEALESRALLSGTPPTVTDLHVASTEWTPAFYDYLKTHSMGDLGYRIPTGSAAQTNSLPWFNIDQFVISFSEDVNVKASDLSLSGISATLFPISHFFYDAFTYRATWTFEAPLPNNVYQLDLDANGVRPIRDPGGAVLDGEWVNNSDTFSSGNGVAGGDFEFLFKVMPGDVNQNNSVEYSDYYASSMRQGLTTTSVNYNAFADVDGSGVHESQDAQDILSQLGATYPAGSPVGVTNDAPSATSGGTVRITNADQDVAVSLFNAFQDAETPDNQLVYEIVSNSNPSLFDSTSINTANGTLVLNAASGASGRSKIIVKATDAAGLSTFATFVADVAYANQAPTLSYTVECVGADTFRIIGTVNDDDDVEGLLVQFWGSFNLRATVKADRSFEFSVVVHEPDWGMEWAQVSDFQGISSPEVESYVGVT